MPVVGLGRFIYLWGILCSEFVKTNCKWFLLLEGWSYMPSCWSLGHQFRSLSPGVVLLSELFCQILSWHLCSYWLQSNLKHVGISLPEVQQIEREGRRKIAGGRVMVKTRLQIRTKKWGQSICGSLDLQLVPIVFRKYRLVGFIVAHIM